MEQLQDKPLLTKRLLIYCLGLYFCSLGATSAINSGAGLPPIGSLPYVLHLIFPFTLGTVTAVVLSLLVLLQILILRRDYKWINLAQAVSASIFGAFIDLNMFLFGGFQLPTYFGQLTMVAVSILFLAAGITLIIKMPFVPLPVEGLVGAISQKTGIAFHRSKIGVDCSFATTAILLSLLFLSGLAGVREGTILSAIFVGKIIPYSTKAIEPLLRKIGLEEKTGG